MNKVLLAFHIVGNILAQSVILALFPDSMVKYVQAAALIVGIVLAYLENPNAQNPPATPAQ